jgi:hypothetical protein
MLLSSSCVKQSLSHTSSSVFLHRRILFLIFLILPLSSYIFVWLLSTTEIFFPTPLRTANEVLLVVAHPDDECPPHKPPLFLCS